MNLDALFDKLAVDLAGAGVTEGRDDAGSRVLQLDGRTFAALRGESMVFFLPPSTPALGDALALVTSRPVGDGTWVEVPGQDLSSWPRLAEQALAAMRHEERDEPHPGAGA